MKAIKQIVTFIIIIGVVALALNTLLGPTTMTYLTKERIAINGVDPFFIWKIDVWGYINNVQLTATDISVLEFKLPTRQWTSDLLNDLAFLLDILILILNVILYPIRLGAYFIRNILAFFGINQNTNDPTNGLAWLVYLVRDILMQISIPYV